MDINARINWRPGMELTTQTFLDMDENLDIRQQIAIRAALGDHCIGLLPDASFSNEGVFYTNKYEIDRLQCTALLPSGRIIQVDEAVSISIPFLYGDVYYLAVGIGKEQVQFEKLGVSYVRPQYTYDIMSLEEVKKNDVFPVTRFTVKEGVFTIDKDFIPPCLLLASNNRFAYYRDRYADLLQQLGEHANFKEGDGKRDERAKPAGRPEGYAGTRGSVYPADSRDSAGHRLFYHETQHGTAGRDSIARAHRHWTVAEMAGRLYVGCHNLARWRGTGGRQD